MAYRRLGLGILHRSECSLYEQAGVRDPMVLQLRVVGHYNFADDSECVPVWSDFLQDSQVVEKRDYIGQ